MYIHICMYIYIYIYIYIGRSLYYPDLYYPDFGWYFCRLPCIRCGHVAGSWLTHHIKTCLILIGMPAPHRIK